MKHTSDSHTRAHVHSRHDNTKPDIDSAYAAGFRDGAEQVRLALEAVRNTLVSYARRSKDISGDNVTPIKPSTEQPAAPAPHANGNGGDTTQQGRQHE